MEKICLMQKTISFENNVTEKNGSSVYGKILFTAKKKKKNQLRIM